tara:strand:- start:279 stop:584 length:306 start_codon:yes stop_codon:yes gene_type:complete
MNEENNPFIELSQIFIDNQREFNQKCKELTDRTTAFVEKMSTAKRQIHDKPFEANLNLYLNIEEEARLMLVVAKEVEFQRDRILETVSLLKKSNKIKLNKN